MQADIASVTRVHISRQPFRSAALHARHRQRRLAVGVRTRGFVDICFGQLARNCSRRPVDRHDRQRLDGGPGLGVLGTRFRGGLLPAARSMQRVRGYSP